MKQRKGFVSNSSSSSFIVAQNPGEKLELRLEVPKNKIIVCKTIEDLTKEGGPFRYYESDELKSNPEYKKAVKAIKYGKEVKYFEGDSEDFDSFLSGLRGVKLTKKMVNYGTTIINDGSY